MFIAIDIGNTNITVGIKRNTSWEEYRIGSDEVQPLVYYAQQLAQIAEGIDLGQLEGVAVSSVVPHLTEIILDATRIELHKKPLLFQRKCYHLLPVQPANPEEIGTDLLANSLAAYTLHRAPCLIVDFGTALTYTYINANKEIAGVAIAPGIKTAMQALAGNAAQLPEVPLELPDKPLGTNTVEAMSSGILWGFVGQVGYMIGKIKQATGQPQLTTIATGGLSEVLEPLKAEFDVIDRYLTLEGIYQFFKLYQDSRPGQHAG